MMRARLRRAPRRIDPLADLSDAMRCALRAAAAGELVLHRGRYAQADRPGDHSPRVILALAERGHLRLHAGPAGDRRAYRLTKTGGLCAEEIRRRAEVRRTLIAEREAALETRF